MSIKSGHNDSRGRVIIVGAGPGDPELLTVKALRAIESADLILYDLLVSDDIIALFPKAVPAFFVGKAKGNHSIAQQDLNQLMLKKVQQGFNVVRLKGGDPFVFGRGFEELQYLAKHGIEVDVVPGVTAASGCSASARIPLTHRGLAQGCTFVTAHAETTLDIDWQALAKLKHTLVFYMGLSKAQEIQGNLLAAGLAPKTPVAVVENGSRDNQREFVGELQSLTDLITRHRLCSPALILVGDVVAEAEKLGASRATTAYAQTALAEAEFAVNQCA